MDAVCLAGAGLAGAGLVTRRARNSAALAVLWWFYDSVQRVMNHDPPLLFEAGFVAIFAAKPAVNPAGHHRGWTGLCGPSALSAARAGDQRCRRCAVQRS
jgi:hypothetical protein